MIDVVFVVPEERALMHEEFGGTLLLATILRKQGISATIHRYFEVKNDDGFFPFVEQTVAAVLAKEPKIVSFYCRCDCYLTNLMIAKGIKEQKPEIYIVFGGPQADASAVDTLQEIPWVDFCCSGEGETTVYPLFSALLSGTDYRQTPGLVYRAEDKIVSNPDAPLWEDLDTLPYVDFDLIPPEVTGHADPGKMVASIEAGRGCPFNCAYCSSSLFWKRKFRLKSAKRIVREMLDHYEAFHIDHFLFEHDLFTVNKKKLLAFTQELQKLDIKFWWACSARVDTLDEETITAMTETGMRSVFLGIETGSERMQKYINKNLKMSDVLKTAQLLTKNKIRVTASFIYGFPEETEEDLEQSLQIALQLHRMGVQNLQFHSCVIFPGTDYHTRYFDQVVISQVQSNIVGDFGFAECADFIHDHKKLFSFCYEYPTPLRTKYAVAGVYFNQILKVYDKLSELLPDTFREKKLTDFSLEIAGFFADSAQKSNAYTIAMDYVAQTFTGEEQKKLTAALQFYRDRSTMKSSHNVKESFNTYPIDIAALLEKKPVSEIALRDTTVFFTKQDGEVSTHILF